MRVFFFVLVALLPAFLGLVGFIFCFNLIADLLLGADRGFWGTLLISPICLILGTFLFSSLWAFVIAPVVGFFASLLAKFGFVPASGFYYRSVSLGSGSVLRETVRSDIIDVTPTDANPNTDRSRLTR